MILSDAAQCDNESAREDHFLDIPLVIKPFGAEKAYSSVVSMGVLPPPPSATGSGHGVVCTAGGGPGRVCGPRDTRWGQPVLLRQVQEEV